MGSYREASNLNDVRLTRRSLSPLFCGALADDFWHIDSRRDPLTPTLSP
jgi:hypothetical protein